MADFTVRSTLGFNNNGAVATIVLTPPTDSTAPVAGDLLIVGIEDTLATTGTTVTGPTGWSALKTRYVVGSRNVSWWWKRYAASGEPTTYTWTGSGSSAMNGAFIWGPGGDTNMANAVIGTTAIAGAASTSQTAPSVTTTTKSTVLSLFTVASSTTGQTDAQNTIAGTGWSKLKWFNAFSGTLVNSLFAGILTQTAPGATAAAVYTHSGASTANLSSFQVAIPTAATPVVTSLAARYFDGSKLIQGKVKWYDNASSTTTELKSSTTVWPGRKVHEFFLGNTPPVIAHRCGSANFLEHTLRGATQSAIDDAAALEISVACTSDGVLFGLHDASLDRTTNNTGGGTGTSLVASSLTWAQVQTYQQNYPAGTDATFGAGPYPYQQLTDFLTAYATTHTIFIDPKVLTDSQRQTILYPLLQTYSNWQDTFVLKFFHTGTTIADEATALGLKSWGYGYAGDVDGTNSPQMSATQSHWSWLGMDYTAPQADWNIVLSYGKPVLGHITPTYAAAQTALGFGASGIMASGVNEVTTGIKAAAAFTSVYTENWATTGSSPAPWTYNLAGGSAVVTTAGSMLLKSPGTGYQASRMTLGSIGTQTDLDITGTFTLSDTTEQALVLGLRTTASPTSYYLPGYHANISPANAAGSQVDLMVGATDGSYEYEALMIKSATATDFPALAVGTYNYRWTMVSTNRLALKIWQGTQEPNEWMWTASVTTDNQATTGYFSIEVISGNTTNTGFTLGPITIRKGQNPPRGYKLPLAPTTATDHGHTYNLAYYDDFTKPSTLGNILTDYPNMGYYNGTRDTSKQGYTDPTSVLSVHDGVLDYWLHTAIPSAAAQASGAPATAVPLGAVVLPDNYAPHTHGIFSVRMWTDTAANGAGYKVVPLLWPSSNQWNDGEIDWPEADVGQTPRPANAVPGTLVTDGNGNSSMTFVPANGMFSWTTIAGWHTYTTAWHADGLYFYMDSELVGSVTDTSKLPAGPMRYTLQVETFINEGTTPSSTSTHVLFDWVQIWS